jgi:hypothetical protein
MRDIKARGAYPHWERKLGKARAKTKDPRSNRSRFVPVSFSRVFHVACIEAAVITAKIPMPQAWLPPQRPGQLFQFFAGTKDRHSVGIHGNDLAGLRVTRFFTTFAGTNLESPKTTELDYPVLVKGCFELFKELVYHVMNLVAVHTMLLMDPVNNLSLGQFFSIHDPPLVPKIFLY